MKTKDKYNKSQSPRGHPTVTRPRPEGGARLPAVFDRKIGKWKTPTQIRDATQRWVVASFDRGSSNGGTVIPAKAGIQFVSDPFLEVCGMDSRFRGNDVGAGAPISCKGRHYPNGQKVSARNARLYNGGSP